jgi:diguanylate cyclase (GGDEF)-like protein
VWVLIAALGAVTVLAWVALLGQLPAEIIHHSLSWVAVSAALVGALLLTVTFLVRGDLIAIGLSQVPLVVGAVYLSPRGVLLATVVAQVIVGVVKRRPPSKTVFNVLSLACAAAAALAVYYGILGGRSPVSLRGWGACALATVVASLVTTVAVQVAITVSARRWAREEAMTTLRAEVATAPVGVVLVLLAVNAIWASRVAGLLFVVVGVMALIGQRSSAKLRRRYANLERLYRFAERTSGVSEVGEVVASVLGHAREVMGAGSAEVVLPDLEGYACYCLDADDRVVRTSRTEEGGLERLVHATGAGLLASYDDQRAEVGAALDERNLRNALAALLTFGDDLRGVLIVGDRHGTVTFDEEDLRLFEVLASHSGVAIRGGRLLDRLRREVTAREHEALHDSLTGLANRSFFDTFLQEALLERSIGRLVAVLLMDLDGFKEINDSMGHHVGDSVLRELAVRLTTRIGEQGIVARLGGDEFGFVLPDLADAKKVGELAHTVLSALAEPVFVDGVALELRASLGVSIAPEHGEDRSNLLRRADVAMYGAKSAGGGIEVYDAGDDRHSTRRLVLAADLRAAPQSDDIEVWYQPQADLMTGVVVGCEALLRWTHPLHGSISPDEFIPVAERSGIIGELTWRVLETAIGQAKSWHDQGLALGVSVNVSARTLLESDLLDRLARMLTTEGLESRWLTLELTESSIMADPARSERMLAAIAQLGIQIAIDDFGTGYSSLSRLKQLPIHVVKIDKSFVMAMSTDAGDSAIVRSTIELARNLGHTVVAEGVEDQVTWDQLSALGCDQVQGYFLARPMTAAMFDVWIHQRRRGHLSVVHPVDRPVNEAFGA